MRDLSLRKEKPFAVGLRQIRPRPGIAPFTTAEIVLDHIRVCKALIPEIRNVARVNVERQLRDFVGDKIRGCQDWLAMVGHKRSSGCIYREVGISEDRNCMTEHPIPVADLARLHLEKGVPLEELIFYPVARIRKSSDVKLPRRSPLAETVALNLPFSRYAAAGIEIAAFDGEVIPAESWTLEDHFRKLESCEVIQSVRRQILEKGHGR